MMKTSWIFSFLSSAVSIWAVDPIVDLSYSKYEGTALPGGVTQWLGIRYAVINSKLQMETYELTVSFAPIGPSPWPITICSSHTPSLQLDRSEGQQSELLTTTTKKQEEYTLTLSQHGTLCLANQAGPGLQYGKQPMDEDCLFLDVYAPTNATAYSNLPVMVFIQGGGWSSDSNGNFNGSLLVSNSGMNMIVVTLNYRVGLLGSLASKEVVEAGSLNNGLKDGKLHL